MDTQQQLDALMRAFLAAVSFEPGARPDYERIRALFIAPGLLIKNTAGTPEISGLEAFIEPRRALVDSGRLTRFLEAEVSQRTQVFGQVAQRMSVYTKDGVSDGAAFSARGVIFTQFISTPDGWRISSMAWDDERPGLAIPAAWLASSGDVR